MVMDDEEFMRQILEEMLNIIGYDVICAAEGMEALAIFAEHEKSGQSFAAVILDLTVTGGKGGREIIGEIRKLNAGVPVIASSGYSDDPVIADPARFGFTVSIKKPYTMKNLEEILSIYSKKAVFVQ